MLVCAKWIPSRRTAPLHAENNACVASERLKGVEHGDDCMQGADLQGEAHAASYLQGEAHAASNLQGADLQDEGF
eukprot:1159143-Pelagomonas_calceolata.AAC.6